jgi:hypothetical protein
MTTKERALLYGLFAFAIYQTIGTVVFWTLGEFMSIAHSPIWVVGWAAVFGVFKYKETYKDGN